MNARLPGGLQRQWDVIWPRLYLQRSLLLLLTAVLLLAFWLDLCLGSVDIPSRTIWQVLFNGEAVPEDLRQIVLYFRLPRALTAALAGMALGVSGLQMQTFFRNPLADPYVLGISSGASLGVALVLLLAGGALGGAFSGLAGASVLFGAFSGSALAFVFILLMARKVDSAMTLLILGLVLGYVTSALVTVLMNFSSQIRLQGYVLWTFGSFSSVTWAQMKAMAPLIGAGLGLAFFLSKPLNALLLGEDYARSMGLSLRWTRFGILCSASLLTASVTAYCGPIGFIGIAVPHLCRSLFNTSDHRKLVPAVILLGALAALLADLACKIPGSDGHIVLPLNAVMALIGAPVILWVILRRPSLERAFKG